jgi:hypothetical protein
MVHHEPGREQPVEAVQGRSDDDHEEGADANGHRHFRYSSPTAGG